MTTETIEQLQCSICGELVDSLCDNNMCEKCDSKHYECDACGALTHEDDLASVYNSSDRSLLINICNSCYEDSFVCERCHQRNHGESYEVDGEIWCERCTHNMAYECDRCGEYTASTSTVTSDYRSDADWCDRCLDNHAWWCDNCNLHHRDGECCPNEAAVDDDGIHEYDYEPEFVFIGSGNRHYGIELEVENIDGAYSCPSTCTDNIYYKHDGSLNNGFEIVTHPHTLGKLIESYNTKSGLFEAVEFLQDNAKSHNTKTCGLHIHVSKPDSLTSAKMFNLVANNIEVFEKLCRRRTNSYCCIDSMPTVGVIDNYATYSNYGTRYGALSYRDDTLEFRLPRGTLKASTIIATVEMLDAMVEYCSETSAIDISIDGYLEKCKTYKHLSEYDRFVKLINGEYDVYNANDNKVSITSEYVDRNVYTWQPLWLVNHCITTIDRSADNDSSYAIATEMCGYISEDSFEEARSMTHEIIDKLWCSDTNLKLSYSKIDVGLFAVVDTVIRLGLASDLDDAISRYVRSPVMDRCRTIFSMGDR